jgi:diadenosine tetraphosphate (Ap4A) HIT family hydrolase
MGSTWTASSAPPSTWSTEVEGQACAFCAQEAGAGTHEVVESTSLFRLGLASSHDVPGWLLLWSRRHSEGPAELTDDEAAELGLQISRVSRALHSVMDAEKVYVVWLGENHPHFHVLFAARTAAMWHRRGTGLLEDFEVFRDAAAAAVVAAAVRTRLTGV